MKFLNCLTEDGLPVPWDPSSVTMDTNVEDQRYFSKVLAVMARHVADTDITVILTRNTRRLPRIGDDVVVVLLGDENARVPDYLPDVRAVFKDEAIRPRLGCRPFRRPSLSNSVTMLPFLRSVALWSASGIKATAKAAVPSERSFKLGALKELPIGTGVLECRSIKPIAERSCTLFFGGSVKHQTGLKASVKALAAPKSVARRAMLSAVEDLCGRNSSVTANMQITNSYVDSIDSNHDVYAEAMMDSVFALCPRGTTPETTRFFQALQFGTIVVTDVISPSWFYSSAPVVKVDRWRDMPNIVSELLENPWQITKLHQESLRWWSSACNEEAVGRYMAMILNSLIRR